MKREAKMQLFLSDARGQYIPRDFALSIKRECLEGVDPADLDYLARGPGGCLDDDDSLADGETVRGEWYWDTWQTVCDNAVVTDPLSGVVYTVYQDGDCWLVEQGAQYLERPSDAPGIDTMFYVDDGEEEDDE